MTGASSPRLTGGPDGRVWSRSQKKLISEPGAASGTLRGARAHASCQSSSSSVWPPVGLTDSCFWLMVVLCSSRCSSLVLNVHVLVLSITPHVWLSRSTISFFLINFYLHSASLSSRGGPEEETEWKCESREGIKLYSLDAFVQVKAG